jgi:GNAT superfamily N-acetyltransferase
VVTALAEIRTAVPAEGPALHDLHRRSSSVWEEDRVQLDAHPDALGVDAEAIARGRVRVALGVGGELLGFAVVADGPGGVCVLDDLFVEPALMRQGIGRALVEDAAARALGARCREMTVIAHPRNFAFYESVGFVRGEPQATRFGPATCLRRELTSDLLARTSSDGDPPAGQAGTAR